MSYTHINCLSTAKKPEAEVYISAQTVPGQWRSARTGDAARSDC